MLQLSTLMNFSVDKGETNAKRNYLFEYATYFPKLMVSKRCWKTFSNTLPSIIQTRTEENDGKSDALPF